MIGISNSSNASVAFAQVNDFTCQSSISGAIFSASVQVTLESLRHYFLLHRAVW
jgi:hypothetical protein